MPQPWSLLALPPLDLPLFEAMFEGIAVEVAVPADRSSEAVCAAAKSAEIVLGDWTGAVAISAAVVAAAPRLAFVHQPSVGVDSVDVSVCTSAAVPVANAGDSNVISVSEWCLGATLAALRSIPFGDSEVRAGRWPQLDLAQRGGGELAGRRVGVVGMGRIGRACAERFGALGCEVAHWSRTHREAADAGGAPWLPLEDLLRRSDVLVVVVALAPETRGLLTAERLALLPAGAFVINAARGGIVAEDGLLAAVQSRALAGAALDVYATEPLPPDSPLRSEDRIVLSPHAAGATRQAQGRLIDTIVANVGRAVSGQPVVNVVNGVDPVIRRREG